MKSISINGKTPIPKRDKLIKEFHDDGNPVRVLIFSSVGSAGLNLSVADVVIFFVSTLIQLGISCLYFCKLAGPTMVGAG